MLRKDKYAIYCTMWSTLGGQLRDKLNSLRTFSKHVSPVLQDVWVFSASDAFNNLAASLYIWLLRTGLVWLPVPDRRLGPKYGTFPTVYEKWHREPFQCCFTTKGKNLHSNNYTIYFLLVLRVFWKSNSMEVCVASRHCNNFDMSKVHNMVSL